MALCLADKAIRRRQFTVKVETWYLEHTLAQILRYLELFLPRYELRCYLELRYLELFAISN